MAEITEKRQQQKISKNTGFEQCVIDIARVTRVMAGGKRMRFRACMVVGDKKGKVAIGIAKGADVTEAINKAIAKAKKSFIKVPIFHSTIPHRIQVKLGAAKILFKPAPIGTGIKAGGVVRTVLSLAGVDNVVAKILGSKSKINNAQAAIKALGSLKPVKEKKSDKKEEEKDQLGKDKKNTSSDKKNQKELASNVS